MYFIYRDGVIDQIDEASVTQLRESRDQFDLWIDLETREIFEAELGKISLFSKKVLGRLLCYLIINTNKKYTAEELFGPVWCLNVSDLSEERTVKTSISRLRKLIEPISGNWKYICKTEPSFLIGRRGEYYFNKKASYCLVCPERFQLF